MNMRLSEAEPGGEYTIAKMQVPPPSHGVTRFASIKVISRNEKCVVFHCAGTRWSVSIETASKIWLQKI